MREGETVHVETINPTAVREGIDGARFAAQSMARGVDCKHRRMLPSGAGTDGYPVFIERSATSAAQELLDERGVSLLISAPRR